MSLWLGTRPDDPEWQPIEELQRQNRLLRALYVLGDVLIADSPLERIYDAAISALIDTLEADRASVLRFDQAGVMRFRAWRGLSDAYRLATDGHSPWARDTVDPEPVLVDDAGTDPGLTESLRQVVLREGIRALAFIPIVYHGRLLGKFMLYFDRPHRFEVEEIMIARTIAGHIAFALGRAEAAEELATSRDRLALLYEAERIAREQAQEATRIRDEFLSIASHELRTPLTSLQARAQLALRRIRRDSMADPAQVMTAFEEIRRQTERLGALITQLLDISRLQAGRLTLERERLDLVTLVGQAIAALPETDEHVIELRAPEHLFVEADGLRLEQVLTNVLDNAAKYSPDGGRIEVDVRELAPPAAEIAVRDHGLGIPPGRRAAIFERYYRAHTDSYQSGLGLGLYISRQIVELHGGTITAEFPDDGGARFVIVLPVDGAAAPRDTSIGSGNGRASDALDNR